MFLRYLFYAFLIYLAYRLIFHFIIPIYKTTKQVKKQFSEMSARMNRSDGHGQMQDYMNQQASYANAQENGHTDTNASTKKDQPGDYIDFEEVK